MVGIVERDIESVRAREEREETPERGEGRGEGRERQNSEEIAINRDRLFANERNVR